MNSNIQTVRNVPSTPFCGQTTLSVRRKVNLEERITKWGKP